VVPARDPGPGKTKPRSGELDTHKVKAKPRNGELDTHKVVPRKGKTQKVEPRKGKDVRKSLVPLGKEWHHRSVLGVVSKWTKDGHKKNSRT
jgi:hypothetical protein